MSFFHSLLTAQEGVILPDPVNVANFIASSSSNAVAAARDTNVEITSINKPLTWSIWFKGDNLSKLAETLMCASDTTLEQYTLNWVGEDSTTVPRKLQFVIFNTSGAGIFKQVQSSTRILRNRWYHIIISDEGLTGAAAGLGLKMYINNVLDAVGTTTGTFVSPYSTAGMRFKLGGSVRTGNTKPYGGQLSQVAVFDGALAADKRTQLYNDGIQVDPTTLPFWAADGVEYFPLTANTNGAVQLNLTPTAVTFPSQIVSPLVKSISFRKASDTNIRYIAFGNIAPLATNNYAWYGRDGSSHILEGNMHKSLVDVSDFIAAPVNSTVFTEVTTARVSGVAAGNINNTVGLFYAKFNDANVFVDAGRRVSTDGLVGSTFGAYVGSMPTTYPRYEFYGRVTAGFAAQEYFVPFFEHNNGVAYRVSVFKTTDNGANYSKITVYENSTIKLAEPAIINLGNNTLMLICRRESSSGLYQIVSTDGGNTWGAPAVTNLGSGICNATMCLDDTGKIVLVFMDRGNSFLWVSRGNTISTILASPTSWTTAEKIGKGYTTDSHGILGYAGIRNVGGGKYVITYSSEFSSTRADLFWGYGDFTTLGG